MATKNSFLLNRLKGVGYAFKGAFMLLKYEASIQVQAFIAIVVTIAGFYFEISSTEWLIQILTIGVVMGMEGANSATEELADFIHPEHHTKIGYIKDVAAGAVLFAAIAAVIIAGIIYIPKF